MKETGIPQRQRERDHSRNPPTRRVIISQGGTVRSRSIAGPSGIRLPESVTGSTPCCVAAIFKRGRVDVHVVWIDRRGIKLAFKYTRENVGRTSTRNTPSGMGRYAQVPSGCLQPSIITSYLRWPLLKLSILCRYSDYAMTIIFVKHKIRAAAKLN